MSSKSSRLFLLFVTISLAMCVAHSQTARSNDPDLTREPTLYVVGYAHLDTQWRWEYPQVIREYLPKTMHDNFALFEKYPHYTFNFTGANRYRMMKEYWPQDYAKLKQYVAAGRWFPAGSSMEEGDVNSPSAESIIRQILYGTQYFRHEFGKTSAEYMLPDCFGFPASLPSILAHMGLKGFSTQKLTWGSAAPGGGPGSIENTPIGTPFNVGFWEGPDGRDVIAAFNPGSYGGQIREDITKSPIIADPNAKNNPIDWPARVNRNGKVSGLFTDYHYYGTGDTGGSPSEASVKMMEAIVTKGMISLPGQTNATPAQSAPPTPEVRVGEGPLHVLAATAEQMFLDIKPDQISRLPRFKGELQLTNHSAGGYSSETYQKRWNRKNELLADAAEKASVAAAWLGGRPYPQDRLNKAWTLVMGLQFHDTLPGTQTPKAFEFSWNDDVIAMNQFSEVLTSATEAIVSGMNTETRGVPIVVYNPLNIAREDVVEANVTFASGAPGNVRVFAPDGTEVPAQLSNGKVLFLAKAPSAGYAVYDVRSASSSATSGLMVSESSLENARYRIKLDQNGDVSSIFDKKLNREILSAPIRLAIKTDKPEQWPAWNMDYSDQQKPPRAFVGGPVKIRVVENGPVRVGVEVERETEGSKFVQTIRLSAGDAGNRIEFSNVIDWNTREANLKATFPFAAANPSATYNWDVGTIERGNNDEKKFEVPSHQWIDLTDKTGAFGVTVLTDCKNGSDKPDNNTIRLTLMRTPGIGARAGYGDQATQDLGHHEFIYGLVSHPGDWRKSETDWQAQRLNQPLIAFQSDLHAGALGKTFSILKVNNSRVRVLALKKAEESDEVIVRVVELNGEPQKNVRLSFAAPIISAREMNGQELPIGRATVSKGELVTDLGRYQLRTFAVKLAAPRVKLAPSISQSVTLPYDISVTSTDGTKSSPGFDSEGRALPAEMLPRQIEYDGIRFQFGRAPVPAVADAEKVGVPTCDDFIAKYEVCVSDRVPKAAHAQYNSAIKAWRDGWRQLASNPQTKSSLSKVCEQANRQARVSMKAYRCSWETPAKGNAVVAKGQTIVLPSGSFNLVYVVAASSDGDQAATFRVGDQPVDLNIQYWSGFIGQWDDRQWKSKEVTIPPRPVPPGTPPDIAAQLQRPRTRLDPYGEMVGIKPGFIKRDPIAWFVSHRHTADGANEYYAYSYLFAYAIDVPAGARTLKLPNNDKIRVLAITAANQKGRVWPAQPLYDTLERK